MIRSVRNYVAAGVLAASVTTVPVSAAASVVQVPTQQVIMNFDGQVLQLPDQQFVFIINGITYVPIRFTSYALQKMVQWDGTQRTVTVSEPTDEEKAKLIQYLEFLAHPSSAAEAGTTSIAVTPIEAKLIFDGVEKQLLDSQSIYSYKGSIYVPIRFMSEAVGTTVEWDSSTKTITGQSLAYLEAQQQQSTESSADETVSGGSSSSGSTTNSSTTVSYDSITSAAEEELTSLQSSCETSLKKIASQYVDAETESEKEELVEEGKAELEKCTKQFEEIVGETTEKLTANGYSTDIIDEYREEFEEQLEIGKAWGAMLGIDL